MSKAVDEMPILVRREVEARVIGPIMNAFIEKLGREEALAVLRPIIEDLALESGRTAARMAGGEGCRDLARAMEQWSAGGAYDQDVLELTDNTFNWDVTRCAYAEMYAQLGMAELGFELSCARDFAMVEGFNPKMKLTRTTTRMQGDDKCDFRLRLED